MKKIKAWLKKHWYKLLIAIVTIAGIIAAICLREKLPGFDKTKENFKKKIKDIEKENENIQNKADDNINKADKIKKHIQEVKEVEENAYNIDDAIDDLNKRYRDSNNS